MLRVLTTFLALCLFQLMASSICVTMGLSGSLVLMGPIAVVFSILWLRDLESMFLLSIFGLFLDIWSASLLGIHLSALMGLWLMARLVAHWTGVENKALVYLYVVSTSFLFRWVVALFLALEKSSGIDFSGFNLWLGPHLDAVIGLFFCSIMYRVLVLFRQLDAQEDTHVRLSRRPSRLSPISHRG